ncbi:patatin-like phospholipase family protein [Aciditerrimonas ferrireducens]|uniref:patatin-like phospholipase family protein n=1 Tax=Aciditerrimonas ferrireducens TaxID=667306 RepID=UPI002004EE43|nr:patatin-like phospholipase family protein [Aciditerrimonas ferrireducens]MCK4176312.1 patatin-like phospholipase family protein [Aciditerrimonas ferrireducens]
MSVAFVLSGGGNLGALQAGALRALVEAGIRPDLVVGTSVGAINGAFFASRPGLEGCWALEDGWRRLRRRDLFRFRLGLALGGFLGLGDHLVGTGRLRAWIEEHLTVRRVEDTPVRFAAVATDALRGDPVVLTEGDLASALLASSAIPGIFPPVRIGDRWLVDGSLAAGTPVLEALALGAREVYVLTTQTAPRRRPPRGAIAMAMNSVSLTTAQLQREQVAAAARDLEARGGRLHLVPSPAPEAPSPFDFRQGGRLADLAYARTRAWLAGVPQVAAAAGEEA